MKTSQRWNETSSERETRIRQRQRRLTAAMFFGLLGGVIAYFVGGTLIHGLVVFVSLLIVSVVYFKVSAVMKRATEVRKMEDAFPDFIDLMASNLRAGMTVDRAMLLSSRKEFAPLDKEILLVGRDIVTGKEIGQAMREMGLRIGSEKIRKTLAIIVSGLHAGGNLSTLLEDTASNIRERRFVEKRSASSVLMYVIFVFFSVAVGAPALFGLSSVLVTILSTLLSTLPPIDAASANLPFTLTSVSVSPQFIFFFCLIFILVIDVLASFVLGLVSTGKERDGFRYLPAILLVSLFVFFISRFILLSYFADFFG